MAQEECPNCGAQVPADHAFAKSALSVLIAAPAVQDMATQMRCPQCGQVFSEREVRHLRSSWPNRFMILFVVLGVSLVIWAMF